MKYFPVCHIFPKSVVLASSKDCQIYKVLTKTQSLRLVFITQNKYPCTLKLGVHYLECVSYARLRIRVASQPFCVDQLNPAGFNVPYVLIRKIPAIFLRGKLEI